VLGGGVDANTTWGGITVKGKDQSSDQDSRGGGGVTNKDKGPDFRRR